MDSDIITTARGYLDQGLVIAQDWLLSPAAWSQFALLIAAYVLAMLINRVMSRRIRVTSAP